MRPLSQILARCASVVALCVCVLGAAVPPAGAQQPSSVNPTASSVKEEQLLRQLNPTVAGRITIPDGKAAVLIQPAGQDWRSFHQTTQAWIGGIAILGMSAVILAF
jgi:formate dehydrogenase subunit gamma